MLYLWLARLGDYCDDEEGEALQRKTDAACTDADDDLAANRWTLTIVKPALVLDGDALLGRDHQRGHALRVWIRVDGADLLRHRAGIEPANRSLPAVSDPAT